MKARTTIQLREANHNLLRFTMMKRTAWLKEILAAAAGLSQSACHNVLMDMSADGKATELFLAKSAGGRPARRFLQNLNWDEQQKYLEKKHDYADMMQRMFHPVTVSFDLPRIVVASNENTQEEISYIKKRCQAMVRSDFLPELIFRRDYFADNFTGLLYGGQKTFFQLK